MGSLDVSDMHNALQQEEELDSPEPQTDSHGKMDTEAASLARSKGWTAPETYDYTKYVTPDEAVAPQPLEVLDEGEVPEWAANALKYEWKDEYGDVGPENEELEEMLFRNEFINRTGLKINK